MLWLGLGQSCWCVLQELCYTARQRLGFVPVGSLPFAFRQDISCSLVP